MENRPRYKSLFWPILLVGVGVTWLLSNLGIIQSINIGQLVRLWPILLIVLGFDIIFSRRYPWVGALLSLVVVGGVIVFLVSSPFTGTPFGPQIKTEVFSTPIGNATAAIYYFESSNAPVEINALNDSVELISAEIKTYGNVHFKVEGEKSKSIHLSEVSDLMNWVVSLENPYWKIGLSRQVDSDVFLTGGSGEIKMDLTGIKLTSLVASLGSGQSEFTLPESEKSYTAEIESGSGSVFAKLPANTDLEMILDGGSGSVQFMVPAETGLRVILLNEGSGNLNIPDGLVNGDSEYSWETPGYATAAHKIEIQILDQGSGNIDIATEK
ncbi:MAG: DUF5668 domain-containing protein [Chloroflexi bacterium]|nr:DUF5668 domain-containing protein [Chloroflexota bacterium]